MTHGASSESRVGPLRSEYLAQLKLEFPAADERVLIVQAGRLAKLELLERFVDERGVIRHRRRGDTFPAVALAERITQGFLATQQQLEARRDAGGPRDGFDINATLAEIAGEIADKEGHE